MLVTTALQAYHSSSSLHHFVTCIKRAIHTTTCATSAVKSMWMTLLNLQGEAPLADYTVLGKVITALLGMFAVGVFAVPTGIVASQFSGFVDDRQEQFEEQTDPTAHTQNSSQQSDPTTSSSSTEPTVKLSVTVDLTNNSNAATDSGSSTTAGTGTIESDTENARLVQEDNVPETSTNSSSSEQQRRHSKHHHTLTPISRRALDNSTSGSRSCTQRVYAVCEGDTWFGELFNKGIIALIVLSVIQVKPLITACIYIYIYVGHMYG
jgi:hypothetical protein